MTDKPKWTDLFGIDPTYDDTTERAEETRQERAIRRQVAEEIALAIEALRDQHVRQSIAQQIKRSPYGWITEAAELARAIGSKGGEQ